MKRIYIGIDPGMSGGIAILRGSKLIATYSLKDKTEDDILDFLSLYSPSNQRDCYIHAVLEEVGAMPKFLCGNVAMFKLGMSFGMLRGMLAALGIPRSYTKPKVWQNAMGVVFPTKRAKTKKGKLKRVQKKKTDALSNKQITKARAQQLYPQQPITHQIADAILIATYCRKLQRNKYAS